MQTINETSLVPYSSAWHQARREALINELKRLKPEIEFVYGKYTTDMVYYTVSVVKSKIVASKQTRMVPSYHDLTLEEITRRMLSSKYLTKQDAIQSIELVLPLAQNKFKECLTALQNVFKTKDFYYGFNYDGDTHGIYNEYNYISFKMDDFDFQFCVNDS